MASPFTVFRKHQKVMLALLTILAMFGFVFLPIILQGMGVRSVENPVVVSTTMFGDLHRFDLHNMVQRRQTTVKFLTRLAAVVRQTTDGGQAEAIQYVLSSLGPEGEWSSDRAIVQTWLLARHAERLGVVVDNQVINAHIREWTEDRVKPFQLNTIIKDLKLSHIQLFDMLREELLALRLKEMFLTSLDGTPPGQRWDYFLRLKRQAEVEAVPVRVADFVDYGQEPGDGVLEPFFEAHKDRDPNPYDPTPGFHEPKRIAVRYFKADYEKFTSPEMIPDEEVREVYEANKTLYDRLRRPTSTEPGPEEPEPEKPGPEPAGPKLQGPEKPEEPGNATAPGDTEKTPEDTEKPAESGDAQKPAENVNQPAGDDGEPAGAGEKPAGEGEKPAGAGEEPAGAEDASDASEQGFDGVKSPFRFAVYQAPEAEADAKPQAASGEKEPEAPSGEKEPEAPSGEKEPEAPSAEPKPEAPPAEEQPEAEQGVPEEIARFIRQMLAQQKMEEALTSIREEIDDYRTRRTRYLVDKEMGKEVSEPEKPDYKALAARHGLTTGVTPLVSAWEIRDYDVGKSAIGGKTPLFQYGFERSWDEYLPEISVDPQGNRYLVWKVGETKARTPEFTDEGVREQVLRAWRFLQAREKAQQRAEELAAEAREAGKSLIAVFADKPELSVIATEPFSWLTRGLVPNAPNTPPRLSRVEGIDTPGEEFMRTVFSLDVGEVGVAFNQPKSVVYVVRVAEMNPSPDALWAMFTSEPYMTYASVAADEWNRIRWAWLQELERTAGLKWERPPRGEEIE